MVVMSTENVSRLYSTKLYCPPTISSTPSISNSFRFFRHFQSANSFVFFLSIKIHRGAMATRNMEITLISARDLNNTGMFAKTKPYAVAWISTDLKNRQWTPVDEENSTNPTWNQVMNFTLDEAALQQGRLLLEVEIYSDSTFGEKEIGRVSVPLKEFLKPAGSNKGASDGAEFVSYQVRKPTGKAKGSLNLSIRMAEKVNFRPQQQPREVATESYEAVKEEPVVAYPVYQPAVSSSPATNQYHPQSYAPQPEYTPPPPHHQSYPPPPPHHQGYPPPPPPPHHQGYPPPPPHFPGYPPPPPPHHHPGYPPPPPPHHHPGYPPPPPHHSGYPPPPPPPHHLGYPLY